MAHRRSSTARLAINGSAAKAEQSRARWQGAPVPRQPGEAGHARSARSPRRRPWSLPVPTSVSSPPRFATSTSGINNGVYDWANATRNFGAVNREGGNGLDYVAAKDPRVLIDGTKVQAGQDGTPPSRP